MAYFEDPAQIKIINFIPVRTVGSPSSPTLLGSYTSLGDNAATAIPTTRMPNVDVQRLLIGLGRLAITLPSGKSAADGIWGDRSKAAMRAFADSLPEPMRLSGVAWGSPAYRAVDSRNMILPSVWASSLLGSGRPATTGGGTPALLPDGTPAGGAPASGGGPAGIPERPSIAPAGGGGQPGLTTDGGDSEPSRDGKPEGGGASSGGSSAGKGDAKKIPWPMIGVGVGFLALAGAAYYFSRR